MEESLVCKDILFEISKHIKDGKTWKSLIFVCKATYEFNTKDKVRKYANHITTLLKFFPDKNWDWYWLSKNPSLSFDFVLARPELNWIWSLLSHNKMIHKI